MLNRLLLLLLLAPAVCLAQQFSSHKVVTLDSIFSQWDEITKTYTPGMSVMQPQKLRFEATYLSHPQPCNNRALETIFNSLAMPGFLKQVSITHCIKFSSASGREVVAWIQDVLILGLKADAQVNGQVEIYADLLAYGVGTDRSRNMPFMLVGRFEPKATPNPTVEGTQRDEAMQRPSLPR